MPVWNIMEKLKDQAVLQQMKLASQPGPGFPSSPLQLPRDVGTPVGIRWRSNSLSLSALPPADAGSTCPWAWTQLSSGKASRLMGRAASFGRGINDAAS